MGRRLIFSFMAVLALWQAAASSGLVSRLFLAQPADVFLSLIHLTLYGGVLLDLASTFSRMMLSFIISAAAGTPLGLFIGHYRNFFFSTGAFLDFARSVPPIVLFPLFMLFFGIGDVSKVAVAAFSGTMIVAVAAMYGARQVRENRLKLARKMGLRGKRLFFSFLFPESLPTIFGGYRLAVSFCLVIVIVTEMFLGGASHGIGVRLVDAQMLYDIPALYALIILSGALGYALNISFEALEGKMVHWRGR